jgi:prepilin signal peptidase PulO-like enzyme (type II secretory pathway)
MIVSLPMAAAFVLAGLFFGSLATVLSHRLPQGQPVGMVRSRCPNCAAVLGPADLVPLLSWLFAGGRCRHCGQPISWRYPVIELATGLLFVIAWWQADGDFPLAVLLASTAFGLLVISVADLEAGIIPDAMLLFLAPVAVVWRWYLGGDWLDAVSGAIVGMTVSYAVRWGFRRWRGKDGLGLGDVKFLGLAGFYLGLSGLGAYLSLSGILGVALGIGWRIAGRGPTIPFGPALCVSLFLGLLFPDVLFL